MATSSSQVFNGLAGVVNDGVGNYNNATHPDFLTNTQTYLNYATTAISAVESIGDATLYFC